MQQADSVGDSVAGPGIRRGFGYGNGMSDRDPVTAAAIRLEAAIERLAANLARPRAPQDMVPRAEVEALTVRLDATIARLKAALQEQAGDDVEEAED